jgi:hypothetical protein
MLEYGGSHKLAGLVFKGGWMNKLRRFIELETMAGDLVQVNGKTVTPFSQALTLRFGRAGFVWNRPVALEIAGEDLVAQKITIVDITRITQLALFGVSLLAGLAAGVLFWLLGRKHKTSSTTAHRRT